MSMNEIYDIGQEIATTSEYTEILTMIHTELLHVNSTLEVIQQTSIFAMAILAGCLAGVACAYFIGKLLRTR